MNSERFDVPRPDEWVFIRPVSDRHDHEIDHEFSVRQVWIKVRAWLQQHVIFNVNLSFVGYTKGKSIVRR